MRKFLYVFFCFCFLLSTGCGIPVQKENKDITISVSDSTGHEERLSVPPRRVVVLSPTLGDMYHSVGGDMVGAAYMPGRDYADYITQAGYVGMPYAVDMEKIMAMKPDMVLGLNALHSRFTPAFEQNGIPYLLFDVAKYDDVKKAITVMTSLSTKAKQGEDLIRQMDQRMDEIEKKYAKQGMTYAAIHGTGQGIFLEVKGSIVCDVADRLGLSDVFGELSMKDIGDKPPLSIEELAMRDPDVIFLTTMVHKGQEEEVFSKGLCLQPVWENMKAVKNGHVYLLPQNLFLSGPGVNYPDALLYLAKQLPTL